MSEIPGKWCFFGKTARYPASESASAAPTSLHWTDAEALARLIPLLGCGEEAAVLAFDGLAQANDTDEDTQAALLDIAAEERVHEGVMHEMAATLPICDTEQTLRAARRLHVEIGLGGGTAHLAKIAALDAAVCTVLSRLLRAGSPLERDPFIFQRLSGIRHDEARHVAVSRRLVLAKGATPGLRETGAEARAALARVLMLEANAFETLGVDPDALERDVRRLPDGLLMA